MSLPIDPKIILAMPAAQKWRENWIEKARDKQVPPKEGWDTIVWRSGRGFGKELALDTPIATADGWSTMGEICIGDRVFDEHGKVCSVIGVYDIEIPKECYRMIFSDGSIIDAGADHQWVTWTHQERKQYLRRGKKLFPENWASKSPITTKKIFETPTHSTRKDTNHCIPTAQALKLPHANLPIDPYLFGYFLGNGGKLHGELSTGSYKGNHDGPFIMSQIAHLGYDLRYFEYPKKGHGKIRVSGLIAELKTLGLNQKTKIPKQYFRSAFDQRLSLLQGLMDSDGCAGPSHVEFCSIDEWLAEAVYDLAITLGQKPSFYKDRATLKGVDCGPRYRISWRPTINPFRLPRKATKIKIDGAQESRNHHRMIEKIELIDSIPMRCISVDSPNKMYLAGRQMIPTHNTLTITQWLCWEMWRVPGVIGHVIAPTLSDVKKVSFEGPVGICATIPVECVKNQSYDDAYNKSEHQLTLINGSKIIGFSATEQAGRLRGPQCHAAICDELREWDKPAGNLEQAFSNVALGCRLVYPDGTPARIACATTPRNIGFLKRLYKRDGVLVISGSSYENISNLAPNFRNYLQSLKNTKLEKVEVYGMDADEEDDESIFKRNWFKLWPHDKPLPEFIFILESYDTAATEQNYDLKKQRADYTASIVLGVFNIKAAFTPEECKKYGYRGRYGALVCDVWQERLGFPDLLEKARMQHRTKWGNPGRRSDIVLIEERGSGVGLRQMMATWGVPTWRFNPGRQNKTVRGNAMAPVVKNGCIFVPESKRADRQGLPRDWCEPFLDQVCSFIVEGSTEHDDMYDAFVQAVHYLQERDLLRGEPEIKYLDPEEQREAEQKEAERYYGREKEEYRGNPYG